MTDLERLRDLAWHDETGTLHDAADLIERLTKERDAAYRTLKETRECYDALHSDWQAEQQARMRVEGVASRRWFELKAAERLIRKLTAALKGLHYVVVSEPKGVPKHLRPDLRRAEEVLEIVASVKRAKRS